MGNGYTAMCNLTLNVLLYFLAKRKQQITSTNYLSKLHKLFYNDMQSSINYNFNLRLIPKSFRSCYFIERSSTASSLGCMDEWQGATKWQSAHDSCRDFTFLIDLMGLVQSSITTWRLRLTWYHVDVFFRSKSTRAKLGVYILDSI